MVISKDARYNDRITNVLITPRTTQICKGIPPQIGKDSRYLSNMSGSLAHITNNSTILVDNMDRHIMIEKINWDETRDFFVKTMPDIKLLGNCVSEKIFSILVHERYMHGGTIAEKGARKYRPCALERINARVSRKKPIEIVLPSFPMKVTHPLKMSGNRADMAEITAFSKFHELREQIKRVYPPGTVIYIVQDGTLHHDIFGRDSEEALTYARDLKAIVKQMKLSDEIKFMDLKEEFVKQPDWKCAMIKARDEISVEILEPENKKHFDAIVFSSLASYKNCDIPAETVRRIFTHKDEDLTACERLIKQDLQKKAIDAAFEFLVIGRAIEHLDLYNRILPGALRASVHKGPGRIPLRFHCKGTTILPWMGVAVKEGNEFGVKYGCEVQNNCQYTPVYVKGMPHYPIYYEKILE